MRADGKERFAIPYPRMRELLGRRHFNFMRGDLERVLLDALGGEQAPVRFGTTVQSFAERGDRVAVRLSGGSVEEFDLLVGADGVHSHTRFLAFGEGRFVHELGYSHRGIPHRGRRLARKGRTKVRDAIGTRQASRDLPDSSRAGRHVLNPQGIGR